MPRTCTICTHEQRREIDRAVLSGESYRGIARHFAVSEDAIERHKKAHLSAQVVKAAERREERRADSLVDQIDTLLGVNACRPLFSTILRPAQIPSGR